MAKPSKTTTTVTEKMYDEEGRLVSETITETVTETAGYQPITYPYVLKQY